MPRRARRPKKIPGHRWHLGQGLGHLGIPQGQRRWRAKVFLPHIRIDHGDALAGLQAAPDEKATVRALAAINGTKDENCAPPVPHNLVCRPVPGWGNSERWLHSAAPRYCARLVLRTANAAPVWRGGTHCFDMTYCAADGIHISARLY